MYEAFEQPIIHLSKCSLCCLYPQGQPELNFIQDATREEVISGA